MSEIGKVDSAPVSALRRWLASVLGVGEDALQLSPLAGDAGNRCYYRLPTAAGERVAVLDSSPQQLRRYLAVHRELQAARVPVPEIDARAPDQGFLLQAYYGDKTYYDVLTPATGNAEALYADALDMLINIQTIAAADLPLYDGELLQAEMQLFPEWYLQRRQCRPLGGGAARVWRQATAFIRREMDDMGKVTVHRDYHSRNLMPLAPARSPGVLDFQDAVFGAILYDVVSLLRDAYIAWSEEQQDRWLTAYAGKARAAGLPLPKSERALRRDFNIVGAQRGLKVVGIFSRLADRDGKQRYLDDIPLAYQHLQTACRNVPELRELLSVVNDHPPAGPA